MQTSEHGLDVLRLQARRNGLYEDIAELKRQRLQIEVQIRSVIEAHTKLLELSKESMDSLDVADDKVAVLKQPLSTFS